MNHSALAYDSRSGEWPFDPWIVGAVVALVGIGMVMVYSATIVLIETDAVVNLYYVKKHLVFLTIGFCAMYFVSRVPTEHLMKVDRILLLASIVLLAAIFVPGLGHTANNATRWFDLGFMKFQPSEITKVIFVIYFAAYLTRQGESVRYFQTGILVPGILIAVFGSLLLIEPDFGAAVVICITTGTMLYLSGMRLLHFFMCAVTGAGLVTALILFFPYRLERLKTFLNPFSDPFGKTMQIDNALIAFGRGDWFGVGLGASLQKHNYLPEAHNDFLLAIIAEELGTFGVAIITVMFAVILWRSFAIARTAMSVNNVFVARLAQGIGALLVFQAMINIGVNTGSLPTKGLTMPFVGTGGSALIMNCVAIGLLIGCERSLRQKKRRRRCDESPDDHGRRYRRTRLSCACRGFRDA